MLSSMYFGFHQPSRSEFSPLSTQEDAVLSNMKMMLNMQQEKLDLLSSKLSQSNELQTTQYNHPSSCLSQSEIYFPRKQFPEKLYFMLEMADAQRFGPFSNAVSWLPNGRAFSVRDEKVFMESIVPLFFKQTKLRSFKRQLNIWGFKRLNLGNDSCMYYNERFIRGSPEELKFMVRISIKSKSNTSIGTTCANQKKTAHIPLKVIEVQLQQQHDDDCTQVSLGLLSDVHVSSQSPLPRESLADIPPSVSSSIGYPPSQYSVSEPSVKRRVSMEDDDVPVGMLDQVGIPRHDPVTLALNDGVPKDEFTEFIDHMIHLL